MSRSTLKFPAFLGLLFAGTFCNSAIVPFMGFYLVDGLGQPPWMLSLYSGLAVVLTVTINRAFGRRIDAGGRVFGLVGIAAGGYALASTAMAAAPGLPVMFSIGVVGYGLSASAISTMFSLGGHVGEASGQPRQRINAYMRATTSTAWMIGPALSFLAAGAFGHDAVFKFAACAAVIWIALWFFILPRDIRAKAPERLPGQASGGEASPALMLAAGFIFCLSVAHGLTFSALPLFFVQEAGLPGFAPGAAFSVKTFVEVLAIFSTPFLIARFGLRAPLFVTTLLAVAAILVLSMVSSLPQMALGSALEGLYYGLFASLGISYVQSFAPDTPARATALYWNTLMVAGLLAGPAVGMIAQASDFRTVILVASGVAAGAVGVLAIGIRAAPKGTA